MHHDDTLRLLARLMSGTALLLLTEHGDLTPFGMTIHGRDATPKPIYPADHAHDVTFDALLDLILLELRSRALGGDLIAAGVGTRLDRVDESGIALAVQLATPEGDAALFAPCRREPDGWVIGEPEPMMNSLFPEGLWWPRDLQ